MPTEEERKQARFQLYLCKRARDPLRCIKLDMWHLEDDRAKQYSPTDSVAVKAREIQAGISVIQKKLDDILGMIQREGKHL